MKRPSKFERNASQIRETSLDGSTFFARLHEIAFAGVSSIVGPKGRRAATLFVFATGYFCILPTLLAESEDFSPSSKSNVLTIRSSGSPGQAETSDSSQAPAPSANKTKALQPLRMSDETTRTATRLLNSAPGGSQTKTKSTPEASTVGPRYSVAQATEAAPRQPSEETDAAPPTPAPRKLLTKSEADVATPAPLKSNEQLQPIPGAESSAPIEIETASFKGVAPGVSTVEEVEKAWGSPKEIFKQNDMMTQLFSVEPFDRVEVSYYQNKVASIVVRFAKAIDADKIAKQLDMGNIRPVFVTDDMGQVLGQAYPERGVLFSFEKESGKSSQKVAHIVLEPISAEPFELRAEALLDVNFELCRKDLETALKLQPNDARANWLMARVLSSTERYEKALNFASEAVKLESNNPRYRITRAQILGQMGRLQDAMKEAKQAAEFSDGRPHVQARAMCLAGDLAASGSRPNYKAAFEFHSRALKMVEAAANDPHPAVRVAAKEALIDAHLGAAHDIAWGDWKDKDQSVPRWLERAADVADDLIQTEGESSEQLFRVQTRALAAFVGVRGNVDPEQWIRAVIQTGQNLIDSSSDPARKSQYQWELGMALYDAVQIYQMKSEHATALKYGEVAVDYLEQGNRAKQTEASGYLLGRLYFRLGAIHAIRDSNHRVAVTWFEKAIPLLDKPIPEDAFSDLGRHGETFVSMGVSFWEVGQREKAVNLTQKGISLMEKAVSQGALDRSALIVPYNNLAAMHRQLGASNEAAKYQEMASRIKGTRLK